MNYNFLSFINEIISSEKKQFWFQNLNKMLSNSLKVTHMPVGYDCLYTGWLKKVEQILRCVSAHQSFSP